MGLENVMPKLDFNISWNLAEYMRFRDAKKRERLKLLCPHTRIVHDPNNPGGKAFKSGFNRIPWTDTHICDQCGIEILGGHQVNEIMVQWYLDVEGFIKATKKFLKAHKKYHKL